MSNIIFEDESIAHDLRVRIEDAVNDAFRISGFLGIHTEGLIDQIRLYDGIINPKIVGKTIGAGILDYNKFIIAVDPDEVKNPEFIDQIVSLSVHEINHLERMRLLGSDPHTLGEVLVSEGIALNAELAAGYKPSALSGMKPLELPCFEKLAESDLDRIVIAKDRAEKGYGYWFDPDPKTHGIAYAGYELGFNIVSGYMKDTGQNLQEVSAEPAEKIIRHWQSKKSGLNL